MIFKNKEGKTLDTSKYTNLRGQEAIDWAKGQELFKGYEPQKIESKSAVYDETRGWINKGSVNSPTEISTDVFSEPAPDLTPQVKEKDKLRENITGSLQNIGADTIANPQFIDAVMRYKFGERDVNGEKIYGMTEDERGEFGKTQYGLTGATVGQVLERAGLTNLWDDVPGFGMKEPEAPEAPAGEAGEGEVDITSSKSALDKKRDRIGTYGERKTGVREEAMEENQVQTILNQINETQEKFNAKMDEIEAKQSEMDMEAILDEEAKIALKNKLEGKGVPMSIVNRKLLAGLEDLEQAQRLERLYDTYELNTLINQTNSYNRNLQLLQGDYNAAMANVQATVDVWVEQETLELQILEEEGQLEKEERARYESEIAYERGLAEQGYVHIESMDTYNQLVKDLGVTADTFNQFFYKDPGSDKIYLKPSNIKTSGGGGGGKAVGKSGWTQENANKLYNQYIAGGYSDQEAASRVQELTGYTPAAEKPLSINQIEQFRRSYGWTPPYGFTQSQLEQYIADNPGATPEELEAGANQAASELGLGTVEKNEQYLSEKYFRDNFTKKELKALADKFNLSKWYTSASSDINRFLAEIMKKVQEARKEGISDDEILAYIIE